MKKSYVLFSVLCCIALVGAAFAKRSTKNQAKGYRSLTTQTQGRQNQSKGYQRDINKKDEPLVRVPHETKRVEQKVEQEQSIQCMQDLSAVQEVDENAVKNWEHILLAGKAARSSEIVQNKVQECQEAFKELCVVCSQETANNLDGLQKQLVSDSLDDAIVVLQEFSDYMHKVNEAGLDDSAKQRRQLEFQLKLTQLMLTFSQKYAAAQEATKRDPLLKVEPNEVQETISKWVIALVDICKEVKTIFCDASEKSDDAEMVK